LLIESCQFLEVTVHLKIVSFTLTANCVPCQTVCAPICYYYCVRLTTFFSGQPW